MTFSVADLPPANLQHSAPWPCRFPGWSPLDEEVPFPSWVLSLLLFCSLGIQTQRPRMQSPTPKVPGLFPGCGKYGSGSQVPKTPKYLCSYNFAGPALAFGCVALPTPAVPAAE
eukprot:CAMPEP_0115336016 /NCGR_PEP_ID=MMETSP0270-20121206/88777_1 /TAXON_ID=71861 /ORGANISM="Scrippsiella trochoidea, Strain CCMP3099" /LENGTH=113 /DNA_ID=CAMNT_0002757153 /DNA_START=10 /DNA_END=348 /DNA_ORIENTATION=-